MYLLNRDKILQAVHAPQQQYSDIRIVPFSDDCLQHTSYYFRLGSDLELQDSRRMASATPTHRGKLP